MKCRHRDVLLRGKGGTARMFSVCKNPIVLKAFEENEVEHEMDVHKEEVKFAKIRTSLVCEDCQYRVE